MRSPEIGRRSETIKQKAEETRLDKGEIISRERGVVERFRKHGKARIAGIVLMAITSGVFAGYFQEAMAGEKRRVSPTESVEEVGRRRQGQVEETGKKYEGQVGQTQRNYSEDIDRIMQGDFGTGAPMSAKYENWDRHSKAFRLFQEKYVGQKNISGETMARDFLEVIKEFPNFLSNEPAQRTIMNEKNFRRLVNIYAQKRSEVNPNENIGYQRALLELQTALFGMGQKNLERILGFSLLMGGGKE
ncbi:MAG: hypothetical protein HYZ69_04195 [Candidatus Colwellbacteria bacterium]|nr:hypothetical protein [Candidatus Colwellbacteria bacterium]